MPKQYHEGERPIDKEEIREILKACNNRRLKPYLYVLASGGMRANEALGLRLGDVDFSESPTKVHIRKENKTKRPRDIFISDEATKYLKQWIEWKYRKRRIDTKMIVPERLGNHLIFTMEIKESMKPKAIYPRVNEEFRKVLKSIGLDERKEESIRGKIVLNSFRHFVYTIIGDQTNTDYALWFQGHAHSTYWGKKPEEKAEIYKIKCMQALTFLDFSRLEASSKNIEVRIDAKDRQIQTLIQEITELKERESLAKSDLDDMRKITKEINEKFKKVEHDKDIYWSSNEFDKYLSLREQLPSILYMDRIPFTGLGHLLKRASKLGWDNPEVEKLEESAIYEKIEDEMIKLGILIGNKLDLKKLAYHDPKGEMLKALKETEIIKKYHVIT